MVLTSGLGATLLYQTRARIALHDNIAANIPADSENIALKAVASLARYVSAVGTSEQEAALEELRDLCVEIEGDYVEHSEQEKDMVKVLSGTAFATAGEVEEALETLGAGSNTENLEAVALIVQVYLSISRPDLAKKEFERAKRWAEDDILLQLIEASIGLITGKDSYSNCNSFYTEQLGNPSLTSPHLLTARGVTRLLRNEIQEAKSDVVAAGLGATKKSEAEELWRCVSRSSVLILEVTPCLIAACRPNILNIHW